MTGTELNHLPPELLEDAARGLLPAERLAAIDAHCAVCAQCRDAYAQERLIAQGTRTWARAAIKRRLADAVAHDRSARVPWPRILAAAAVILVLAGTGLVYRWLTTGTEAPVRITEARSADTAATLSGPSLALDKLKQAPAPAKTLSTPMKGEAVQEQRYALADEPRTQASQREAPSAVAPAPAMKAERSADAGSARERTEQQLILWGAPLAVEADKKDKALTAAEAQQTQVIRNGMGSRAQGTVGSSAPYRPLRVYVVSQQNMLAMYRRGALARPDAIPARIFRDGDTIHVVLLLNSLLSADAIRSASVVEYPPDSLQVLFSGRTLGFKIPEGFLK